MLKKNEVHTKETEFPKPSNKFTPTVYNAPLDPKTIMDSLIKRTEKDYKNIYR